MANFGPGEFGAHLRILPRFKVRTIGSPVYSDDEVILQSVALEPLVLGCSFRPKDQLWGATAAEAARFGLRLPQCLRTGPCYEVNGALELRSFVVHLYRRIEEANNNNLFSGVHNFRFFYPENSAYLCASGDSDKGEVLDALDPAKQKRMRGANQLTPAHVPYLKSTLGDANSPLNYSSKSVWCFESLDAAGDSVSVSWRKPVRVRHVSSGKFLAVNSLEPTVLETTKSSVEESATSELGDAKELFFTAALVAATPDPDAEPGALGSRESMIFYSWPTDVTGESLVHGVNTLRLEHQAASGKTVYFVSAREPKPELAPLESTNDGSSASPEQWRKNSRKSVDTTRKKQAEAPTEKHCGDRVLFSSKLNPRDVLKVLPLPPHESALISRMKARVPLFQLYAYFASTYGTPFGRKVTRFVLSFHLPSRSSVLKRVCFFVFKVASFQSSASRTSSFANIWSTFASTILTTSGKDRKRSAAKPPRML
jgi:hypothetical protein